MVANHLMTKKMFSVYFAPEPAGMYGAVNGQVTFGGLPDSSLYSGSIQWTPKLSSGITAVSNIRRSNAPLYYLCVSLVSHTQLSFNPEILGYLRR